MYGQSDYALTKVLLNRFFKTLLVFVFYLKERERVVFIQDLTVQRSQQLLVNCLGKEINAAK